MCVLPLFFDLYGYGRVASDFGYYLPVTQLTVAVGVFAGVLSVLLALVGIVYLCKRQATSWLFWAFSCVFAYVAPIGIFYLICYNNNEYSRLASEKVFALKATYQCHLQDGYTLTFCPTDKGYCELKSPDGIVKFGHCSEPSFHFTSNEFVVKCSFVKDNLKDGYYDDIEDNPDIRFYVINSTMTTIYDQGKDSAQFALKQISADVKTEAEYIAQVENVQKEIEAAREAAEQAKLEAFKNFRSNDLSAFMLHGRVKQLVEADYFVYTFNKQGKLIDAQDGLNKSYIIQHKGNKLIISYQSKSDLADYGGSEYEIDSSGRLIRAVEGGEDYYYEYIYSQFDENGWPTYCTDIGDWEGEKITSHIIYKDIDKYGNWTRSSIGERKITYYPMGK